jgi:4-hydroxy-tetrahydrodipicolinate reductase
MVRNSLELIVTGCRGRMGQAVLDAAAQAGTPVAAAIDLGDDLDRALEGGGTVIDFTSHGFTDTLVAGCLRHGNRMVIGTTGHTPDELGRIRDAAAALPVVFAPNYSVGVNVLFWLTARATEILGPEFDLEVVEMHHRHKTDAPSGTARRLAEILAETRGLDYATDCRHGRVGDVGARTRTEIGVHALRGGDVVGDHTVVYAAAGERVELTHKASSRLTFASGAVRAARWLSDRAPGLYDMQDVLGLRSGPASGGGS